MRLKSIAIELRGRRVERKVSSNAHVHLFLERPSCLLSLLNFSFTWIIGGLKSGESDIEIINLKLRALVKQHDLFFDLRDHLLRVLFLLDQQLLVKNQSILRVAVEQP